MRIALIMLAAGNSRRFGSNKLLYEIKEKPMYLHILEKLQKAAATITEEGDLVSVVVVTQEGYSRIRDDARRMGFEVLINPEPLKGISSSLQIGLKANEDADACLFTVSDQPWLTEKTIEKLILTWKMSGKGMGCVSSHGKQGNPCIFSRNYYPELMALRGDTGGKRVMGKHPDNTFVLEIEEARELTDMDTK